MTRAIAIALAVLLLAGAGIGVWRATAAPKVQPRGAECADARIAEARGTFKTAYDAGRFDDAVAALDGVWNLCVSEPHGLSEETIGALADDRAIAEHRSGDDRECLDSLMSYWPANRVPPASFRRLSPALQKAMKFNWGLCRSACEGSASDVDALCISMEMNDDMEMRERGFRHVACPFRAGSAAVALGDGTCLAILPPRKPFDVETSLGEHGRDVCPTPARLAQSGGRTVVTRLQAPARSFLNSPQFCCHKVTLGIDGSGRVAAEPDATDGCTSGHYAGVMQDIFRLENGALVMVKQLDEPWFPSP
ncbi:MAG: hypothetical protein ACHP7N_00675 [Caulobacterales bacterium]